MKLLVFGKTGQVATELQAEESVITLSRSDVDLRDHTACREVIERTDADAIINAAAYTAVDDAEDNRDLVMSINATAPSTMARAAALRNIPFIHISTDYVFDGSGNNAWKPEDQRSPLNFYGYSKLVAEKKIASAGGPFVILRTSWVFSSHGNNFVKSMLRLSESRDTLNIVADQFGGPTAAADIANACVKIAHALHKDHGKSGIYHFSGNPHVSWADFAREIFTQKNCKTTVVDISTDKFPTRAKRPANSRLDCTDTYTTFSIEPVGWRTSLAHVLKELGVIT